MSIQTEITRLQGLRNALRTKLVSFGLVQSSADLEDCVTAVAGSETKFAKGMCVFAVAVSVPVL